MYSFNLFKVRKYTSEKKQTNNSKTIGVFIKPIDLVQSQSEYTKSEIFFDSDIFFSLSSDVKQIKTLFRHGINKVVFEVHFARRQTNYKKVYVD